MRSDPFPPPIEATLLEPRPSPAASRDHKTRLSLTIIQNCKIEDYQLPPLDLLELRKNEDSVATDQSELQGIQQKLIAALEEFGIPVAAGDITRGPVFTRYEIYPAKGVRVQRIVDLEHKLSRVMQAERINILAPVPGKGTVGIEISNKCRGEVSLRELLLSTAWSATTARLPIAIGKDVLGKELIADLAQMPHLLIGGVLGSGKSVCIDAIIASLLFRFGPDQVRLILIDPDIAQLQVYNSLPHLFFPVVTDPKKVLLALRALIDEIERRYQIFAKVGVRNIIGFNTRQKEKTQRGLDLKAPARSASNDEESDSALSSNESIKVPREGEIEIPDCLPYIVLIVDEVADLMQNLPGEIEHQLTRIISMSDAVGVHCILSAQPPLLELSDALKANIPARICFRVRFERDSQMILDEGGAEELLGAGDLIYRSPSTSRLIRAQGVLVTDEEIGRLVDFVSAQSSPAFDLAMHERLEAAAAPEEEVSEEDEQLVEKCLEIIRQEKKASTSLLQRRLRLGYTRAARIVDILEQRGILGPGEGAKPREILVDLDAAV